MCGPRSRGSPRGGVYPTPPCYTSSPPGCKLPGGRGRSTAKEGIARVAATRSATGSGGRRERCFAFAAPASRPGARASTWRRSAPASRLGSSWRHRRVGRRAAVKRRSAATVPRSEVVGAAPGRSLCGIGKLGRGSPAEHRRGGAASPSWLRSSRPAGAAAGRAGGQRRGAGERGRLCVAAGRRGRLAARIVMVSLRACHPF